jgi:hypothetical protein
MILARIPKSQKHVAYRRLLLLLRLPKDTPDLLRPSAISETMNWGIPVGAWRNTVLQ